MPSFGENESLGAQNRIDAIRSLLRGISTQDDVELGFPAGSIILEEGQPNDELLILIEGEAKLVKRMEDGETVEVDAFPAGSILGITSFWSRQAVFARVEAISDAVCLSISRETWNGVILQDPDLMMSMQALFVSNLSNRYRNMVQSHVERHRLSQQLEQERNHLKDTLLKLEQLTKRLVNQEKLATMGQLVAGIAHEINNPVGALTRNVAMASGALTAICSSGKDSKNETAVLMEGLCCPFWETDEKRRRMNELMTLYPKLLRSDARRLAQLTDKALEVVHKVVKNPDLRDRYLSIYELGNCLRSASISSTRIETIVKGLKNYGRQTGDSWDESDIRQGIEDTLTVLSNRMKNYEMELSLQDCPLLSCNLGEINQVWTNLLTNAMDATPIHGKVRVSCREGDGVIVVQVEDSGTGIPTETLGRIFEANYTTKNQSGSYGLGLGLSISKDIVEKHNGTISAEDSELGGARFVVSLPLKND